MNENIKEKFLDALDQCAVMKMGHQTVLYYNDSPEDEDVVLEIESVNNVIYKFSHKSINEVKIISNNFLLKSDCGEYITIQIYKNVLGDFN